MGYYNFKEKCLDFSGTNDIKQYASFFMNQLSGKFCRQRNFTHCTTLNRPFGVQAIGRVNTVYKVPSSFITSVVFLLEAGCGA